jgi:hypothetical protein
LSVPYQTPKTTSKSESFWEQQVSAKFGSLTTPSWPKCSRKPQKGGEWGPLVWKEEQEKSRGHFREIKMAFTNFPALGLLDVMKPFFLYVHEREGTAVGILNQLLGSWHRLVAYLSK